MPGRITFTKMPHDELPQAYAAADVFALGSLFETFGIVYIEALAMGLPVFCTEHPNQRSIVREGVFLDIKQAGALRDALLKRDPAQMRYLRERGPQIARETYALEKLKSAYIEALSAHRGKRSKLAALHLQDKTSRQCPQPVPPAVQGLIKKTQLSLPGLIQAGDAIETALARQFIVERHGTFHALAVKCWHFTTIFKESEQLLQ